MPNSTTAKKRLRQSVKREERNRAIRSRVRTYLKAARLAVEEGTEDMAAKVKTAIRELDKAESKGVYKKHTVARLKSRLASQSAAKAK